jgi:hypothetical protein
MATPGNRSLSPYPPLRLPLSRMESEGGNERDVTSILPLVLCNYNECSNTVDDTEMAAPEEFSSSYQDGAAAISAEVVEDRDLQREVQERLDSMTIDAMLVVNVSSNKEEHNKTRSDSRYISTAMILLLAAAALIILSIITSVTIIGTKKKALRPTSVATTIVTAPPSTSISMVELARNILTPLSGEEALMDESSPQYKALWWMVRDDQANKMMEKMADNNEAQLSSMSTTLTTFMERYTMALLYFVTDGPNWVSPNTFLSILSICDWEPIQCSERGAVVGIRIGTSAFCSVFALYGDSQNSKAHKKWLLFLSFVLRILERSGEQFKRHPPFRAVCAVVTRRINPVGEQSPWHHSVQSRETNSVDDASTWRESADWLVPGILFGPSQTGMVIHGLQCTDGKRSYDTIHGDYGNLLQPFIGNHLGIFCLILKLASHRFRREHDFGKHP